MKRSAVKSGTIAVGKKVSIVWGKSKKAYPAEVVDDGRELAVPHQEAGAIEDEALLLETASPAPTETAGSSHEDRQPALIERIEVLTDAVSRLEAKMLCQFQALDERVVGIRKTVEDLKKSHTRASIPLAVTEYIQPSAKEPPEVQNLPATPYQHLQSPPTAQTQQTPASHLSALSDFTNRTTGNAIAQEDVAYCLSSCRSRRNFAARLACKLFSPEERRASNVRGVCGKRALNSVKVQAIFQTCLCHFPLEPLETKGVAEKDMRNAVNEVCTKSKTVAATETENMY